MGYEIISADTHLDLRWLPHDLFVSRATDAFKSHMPRVETLERGQYWFVQGEEFCAVGSDSAGVRAGQEYAPGESLHLDRMAEVGFFDGVPEGIYHPVDPNLRIKDQEIDGIDAEVIYGILGIAGGMHVTPGTEADTLTATYDIYNEYVAGLIRGYGEKDGGPGMHHVPRSEGFSAATAHRGGAGAEGSRAQRLSDDEAHLP